MFDLKKQKEETVSDAAMMVDPAGKKAVFFKDDQLFVTDIPKGKADLSKPVNLANNIIQVQTCFHVRKKGGVFLLDRLPILAMHILQIETISESGCL